MGSSHVKQLARLIQFLILHYFYPTFSCYKHFFSHFYNSGNCYCHIDSVVLRLYHDINPLVRSFDFITDILRQCTIMFRLKAAVVLNCACRAVLTN